MWAYIGKTLPDFSTLLGEFNPSQFKSPRRSTVPLLAHWRDADRRITELFTLIKISIPNSVKLDFEHEVPVQKGRGRPSCTDLMILAENVTIAVEAKFTESRYDDVLTWLGQTPNQNKINVLSGWLGLLGLPTYNEIDTDTIKTLPYQLIHRAASACSIAAQIHCLVYQIFDTSAADIQSYINDLEALAAALKGSSKLRIYLIPCSLKRSNKYAQLEKRWDSGDRDLHSEVFAGLRAGDLLETKIDKVISI
jgi:hypothetical protein